MEMEISEYIILIDKKLGDTYLSGTNKKYGHIFIKENNKNYVGLSIKKGKFTIIYLDDKLKIAKNNGNYCAGKVTVNSWNQVVKFIEIAYM